MPPLSALAALTLLALSLLSVIPTSAQSPDPALAAPTPPRADPFEMQRFTLPNGMRVWVQPRPDSQSLAAMLVFRVGARNEPRELSGISHFVEHMLFAGTERWSETEIKSVITRRGGRWNGWTGYERTTYFAQVSAGDAELALDWLAEIAFRATFPAATVAKERGVIFQEKSGRYGWLINALDGMGFGYELERDLRRALYPGSSLGQRVIGEDESLDRIDRAALLDYYQRYYTPANATLVVVGGVSADALRELSARYFGAIPAGERPDGPTPAPPGPANTQQIAVRGPLLTDQTTLMIGARTVGRGHPDRWPLELLGELLRLEMTQEIRYKRGLVYGLWMASSTFDDTGYWALETTSDGANRAEIQQVLQERLARLRAGDLNPRWVEEARSALVGRWSLKMEDNVERATYLAEWTSTLEDGQPVPDYAALIGAVTAADLVRVAQTYLGPEQGFVAAHQPVATLGSGMAWVGGLAGLGVLGWGLRRWRRSSGLAG